MASRRYPIAGTGPDSREVGGERYPERNEINTSRYDKVQVKKSLSTTPFLSEEKYPLAVRL